MPVLAAKVQHQFGDTPVVLCVWEPDITRPPNQALVDFDINGAVEHVADNMRSWTRNAAHTITRHTRSDITNDATRRSGGSTELPGLAHQ